MFKKTTSSPRETGLENKTEPAGPKRVEARPQVLKIPKNLFLLAEARSARAVLYDVIGEVEQLLRIMRNEPIDPFFKNEIYLKIDAGETLLAEYQQKLSELVSIYPGSCQDIDQLTDDLSAYKQRFIMVKEECMYLSPERTPNISSPSVAKSQPNIAEKSDVQHENPNTPTVPEDPLSPSSTSLEQGDHSETKESLQEEERTGSVPSMEETYNLANLFVSHQESQDIQKGAGIAPVFEVRDTNESTSEATWSSYEKNYDQHEQNSLFNLPYLFNVADHSEVEAANEETDV